jgi:hypothetical protein
MGRFEQYHPVTVTSNSTEQAVFLDKLIVAHLPSTFQACYGT